MSRAPVRARSAAFGRQTIRQDGAVGLICTAAGIAGPIFKGEAGVVLDPTFRWHIGLNTKAMTAALYARLVERRRLRWRATIAELFPSSSVHPDWSSPRVPAAD